MSKVNMNDTENAALSRAYAATAREEPPAALDGAILAQAWRAAEYRARAGFRHWSRLVAIAATLVVTASLVVLMESEQPQIAMLAPPAGDAALAPAAKTPTEAVQPAKVAPAQAARSEEKPASSVKLDVPARAPSGEPSSRGGEQPASPQQVLPDAVNAAIAEPERQAFPAAQMTASDAATASVAMSAPPSAPAAPESGVQRSIAAAPAAASNASGAPRAERRSLRATESVTRNLVSPDTAKKDESPEAWLARIAELRKQGRIKEAEESFAAFRKRYPDYPIPGAKAESR